MNSYASVWVEYSEGIGAHMQSLDRSWLSDWTRDVFYFVVSIELNFLGLK